MIPLYEYIKTIKELMEKWAEELTFQRFRWEEVQKELKKLKKLKSMKKKKKDQMYALSREMMSCRAPYPSYPVFLYEQMTMFKLKSIKEGRPYQLTPSS